MLALVKFCLTAGIAANLVYLATSGIGLAAAIRIWHPSSGWSTAVRVLLVAAIAGSCIALVVQIVALARWLTGDTAHSGRMRTGH